MYAATMTRKFSADEKATFKKDIIIKLICIPVLATGIANISGIITNFRYNNWQLLASYFYFILLAWFIWEGNVRLMFFIRKNIPAHLSTYYKSIIILYVSITVYTAIISTIGLLAWLHFSKEVTTSYHIFFITVMIIVVSAILVTNLYELYYLKERQQDTEKRAEQLDLAKTHAELTALKNQIDPHFLFNSLNTLSYLISSDPVNARLYNDTLAKVYRYILINREKNLVTASDELEFLSNFFYLLKIRYDDAIDMNIEIKNVIAEDLFLPPISLQVLLENAIKHNELSKNNPLSIYVSITSNYVTMKNYIIQKKYNPPTTGTGLSNLDNRYMLLTGKTILIYKDSEHFTVKLPLLKPQS